MTLPGNDYQSVLEGFSSRSKARRSQTNGVLSHILDSVAPSNASPTVISGGGGSGGGGNISSGLGAGISGNPQSAISNTKSLIGRAKSKIGIRYQWGGTSDATGYDCSGFVQNIFGQMGIKLPRTAAQQAAYGKPISQANARKGDLVYYGTGSGVHHIGIYLGNGKFIDAPHTGAQIRIESIGSGVGGFARVSRRR